MNAPQGKEIGPVGLEPPGGARNRRKATVKIRRNPQLQIRPLIRFFLNKLFSKFKLAKL